LRHCAKTNIRIAYFAPKTQSPAKAPMPESDATSFAKHPTLLENTRAFISLQSRKEQYGIEHGFD
jgi:hypothetical protein